MAAAPEARFTGAIHDGGDWPERQGIDDTP